MKNALLLKLAGHGGGLGAVVVILAMWLVPSVGFSQQGNPDAGADTTRQASEAGARTFDKVSVERVRPEQLPEAETARLPRVAQGDISRLPRAASMGELKATTEQLQIAVVELIALHMPKPPFRQTPMIYRGHAVWVSGKDDGVEPVLLTTLDWTHQAQTLYVVPAALAREMAGKGTKENTAPHRSLGSMTMGGLDHKWLQSHQDKLVEVRRVQADEHRNLVGLEGVEASKAGELVAPARGLTIMASDGFLPARIYGYSPHVGSQMFETTFLPAAPDDDSLAFYVQTTFPGILGAPIVSDNGELIALNALAHPSVEKVSLAVPTGSLEVYVGRLQGKQP